MMSGFLLFALMAFTAFGFVMWLAFREGDRQIEEAKDACLDPDEDDP